jgi:DNA helicase-2/ATP-dependent DNA helicase PcrA
VTLVPHEELLDGLNPAQREAVLHVDGPLLVVAGAGSGKTRVLTHRVAHLIRAHGVKPNEILAITFTNKAAGEMRERLERMLGRVARAIWILTFHAACGRILRAEAPRLGFTASFTIVDQADQVRLVKACLEELGKDPKRFTPRGIHAQISNAKNQLVAPAEYAARVSSFWDQTVAEAYDLYQRKLHLANAVDFDDMLMLTVEVLERFPEARERWQKAFRYVLVDEYQDTNHAQYRLLQLLAAEHGNVFCVGDPDQSIYAFRGADITNILDFERDFPGAASVALEQNYRSTNAILSAANAVIDHNRDRKPKQLWSELGDGEPVQVVEVEDEHAEARFVAAELARLVENGLSASEIAVFYRTNAQSRVLEDVLVRQGVPYQVIGGPRFYERAEIRDATAYLSVLSNPADAVSLMRIANRPRRGIGDTTLQRLVAHATALGIPLWEVTADPEAAGVGSAGAKAVRAFRSTMESLMASAHELAVDELLEAVLERSGTIEAYEAERTIEARGRIENLEELVGVAREFRAREEGETTLAAFLEEVQLQSDQDTLAEDGAQITLMTIHNAKGLEYRAVFLIGMEEGIFPHARSIEDNEIEEERRLCYVGMTRAMERLMLTHASARTLFGRR